MPVGETAAPAPAEPKEPATAKPSTEPKPSVEPKPSTEPKPPAEAKPGSASKTPGTEATVVTMKTIEGVMGKSVRSRTGNEDMGHIVDVLVDGGGQIRAAVIDFGGFLGVGSRKVAVAWGTLDFGASIQSGSVKVALTRDQIRQAPEYKPDEPIVILEGGAQPAAAPTPAPPKPATAAPPTGHIQDSPSR